uniref:Uncharacterized protein n=1 Tax=Oryza glaberrima TaxID=4538 RepID=I1R4Y7_ORYGL
MMPLAHRLYNFTAVGDADPSLDCNYAAKLMTRCTNHDGILSEIDPCSRMTFVSRANTHRCATYAHARERGSTLRPRLASAACSRRAAASSTALHPTTRPRAAAHLHAPGRCP